MTEFGHMQEGQMSQHAACLVLVVHAKFSPHIIMSAEGLLQRKDWLDFGNEIANVNAKC